MSLLVTGTYWPSGNSPEALGSWQPMQITCLIKSNKNRTAIVMGDMNATTYVNDRTSARNFPADEMYLKCVASTNLSSPTEGTTQVQTHSQATGVLIITQCTLLAH